MMSKQPHECILCGHRQLQSTTSLTGRQLRSLWTALQNQIGEFAYGAITPEREVILYKCSACGFRFFDPDLAGSGEFYEELMTSKAYPLGAPEFDRAISFARAKKLRHVLDVGGGEGAFLDQAKLAGIETSGVELNRKASEVAAAKGHRMFNMMMEDIPLEALQGGTELLTLFQVIEHVPSPVDFVRDAARLVKPGGYIAVAVPSDRRMLGLLGNDPADWPPHHVSRWRLQDLRMLGNRCGLAIEEQCFNFMYGHSLPWAFSLHNKLETAIGRKPSRLPLSVVRGISLIYRALKLHSWLPFHGLSIRTIYRKPNDWMPS